MMKGKQIRAALKKAAASATPDIWEKIKNTQNTLLPYDAPPAIRKTGGRLVPRFAACIAAALALVIVGSVFTSSIHEKNADAFEIVACAVNGNKEAITLKENVKFTLSSMFTRVERSSITIYSNTSFYCKGSNLASVTYAAQKGFLDYDSFPKTYTFENAMHTFRNTTMRVASAALKKATVCSFEIPKSILKVDSSVVDKQYYHTVDSQVEFYAMWDAGKLKKYTNGFYKDIRPRKNHPSPYLVLITFDWNPINPSEHVRNDVYVVTIADMRNKNFSYIATPVLLLASSVVVEPSDKNACVIWDSRYWPKKAQIDSDIRKAYFNAKSGKGSSVIDTITVTAKFKDGKTETKHIQILFNHQLKCCMKLTD